MPVGKLHINFLLVYAQMLIFSFLLHHFFMLSEALGEAYSSTASPTCNDNKDLTTVLSVTFQILNQ